MQHMSEEATRLQAKDTMRTRQSKLRWKKEREQLLG